MRIESQSLAHVLYLCLGLHSSKVSFGGEFEWNAEYSCNVVTTAYVTPSSMKFLISNFSMTISNRLHPQIKYHKGFISISSQGCTEAKAVITFMNFLKTSSVLHVLKRLWTFCIGYIVCKSLFHAEHDILFWDNEMFFNKNGRYINVLHHCSVLVYDQLVERDFYVR